VFFPRYDVFLSYSRADTAWVAPLRDELRRLGYRVFFDVQSIDPGDRWKPRLERAIKGSRTLVLCWSERAKGSEYITFEYSRAEVLGRPIYPWRLDNTPLPKMLEIQGISDDDPVQVAVALRSRLGWTLGRRRMLQAVFAALCVVGLSVWLWSVMKPPPPAPPWEFQGEVIDPQSRLGIEGVEVDATPEQGATAVTHTDTGGRYDFHLPPPQTKTIHLVFRREGYQGDEATVPAGKPFSTPLYKLP
jgi:hypothetical protein